MRILIGGVSHESNSLNPIITGEEDFRVHRGAAVLSDGARPGASITGVIGALREAGVEPAPVLVARAVPNGVVSASFYRRIKEEFLERTREALRAGPIDGVCLALHGSMKVENPGPAGDGEPLCAEGDLCGELRKLLPAVPFTAALDMHGTMTPAFLAAVDGFAGYKTAPHVDGEETGRRAARMLLETLATGKRLHTAYRRVPMMVAGEKSETAMEPMLSLIAACRELEETPGVLAASLLLGFPWADCSHNAVSVLVSALEDRRREAEDAAGALAGEFWRRRGEFRFRVEHYDARGALETAYRAVRESWGQGAAGNKPVFVSDSGDNPTAGAAGDATDLLERILETLDEVDRLPTPLLYSGFYDAPAAAACVTAGEGAELDLTLGGNWDTLNGRKVPLHVRVEKITRGYGPYQADLVLLSHRGLRVSVTSRHIGFGDGGLLPALGVDPADYCLVAVKLGYLEPCFRAIASRAIMAVTRGCSNEALETIPYRRVRRPLYPLDQ